MGGLDVGETGTTRNADLSNMLLMQRAMNPSFDQRQHNLISPWLNNESRRSIINQTPLRHNPSFMSTNSILPNFGGADQGS